MIDTKSVSPHSMFLNYLRDVAVSLREEPDKWFVRSDIIINNNKDFSEEEFYGWINLTTKTLKIRQRSTSDYGSSYQYDRIYEELAFNGLILKFSGQFFENGIPDTILQTISQNILEGLSTVGEYEQKKTFFAEQEKIFKELNPFGQFSNFYNFRVLKDQRLLDIYSEFISEENIDNVLKDHPTFIADVIFSRKFGDSLSTLEKLFSKQSILKSLANLGKKDFDHFSLVDHPGRMEELYKYIFEDENVPEEAKNELKPLFTKYFFECVENDSIKYFTFGDRFTSLFSGNIEKNKINSISDKPQINSIGNKPPFNYHPHFPHRPGAQFDGHPHQSHLRPKGLIGNNDHLRTEDHFDNEVGKTSAEHQSQGVTIEDIFAALGDGREIRFVPMHEELPGQPPQFSPEQLRSMSIARELDRENAQSQGFEAFKNFLGL